MYPAYAMLLKDYSVVNIVSKISNKMPNNNNSNFIIEMWSYKNKLNCELIFVR